jgi:hypothetical protein
MDDDATSHGVAMTNTDDAAPAVVLTQLLICAESWVPEARIIGNIRAGDISRAVRAVLSDGGLPALVWDDRYDRESVVRNPSLRYRVASVSGGEWIAMNGDLHVADIYFPNREEAKVAAEEHFRRCMTEMLSLEPEDD